MLVDERRHAPEAMRGGLCAQACFDFVVVAVLAVGMASENPFIGGWKLNSSMSRMPDEIKVESKGANKYSFDFGGGPENNRSGWNRSGGQQRNRAVG